MSMVIIRRNGCYALHKPFISISIFFQKTDTKFPGFNIINFIADIEHSFSCLQLFGRITIPFNNRGNNSNIFFAPLENFVTNRKYLHYRQ